jgi:hypothetical protein
MGLLLPVSDDTLAPQALDVGVICGPGDHGTLVKQIETTVSGMGPVGGIVLDQGCHRSGPGVDRGVLLLSELPDPRVTLQHYPLQKTLWIRDWFRCLFQ